MAHHHNSGFAVMIVWQFCKMKGAERGIEIMLMVFLKKKKLIQDNFAILAEKWYIPLTFWNCCQVFYLILCHKKGSELHEHFISFLRKNLIWGNVIFLGYFLLFNWVWWKLSLATVNIGSLNRQDMISFTITAGSWNSKDMIKILKQSRHDFSGKHLCD